MDVANATHFNRRILEIKLRPVGHTTSTDPRFQLHECYIKGTAFLYHQVRCTMSLLFMVGRRQEAPEVFRTLLDVEATPRKPQYAIASDVPLVLYDTGFDEVIARLPSPVSNQYTFSQRCAATGRSGCDGILTLWPRLSAGRIFRAACVTVRPLPRCSLVTTTQHPQV